MPDKTNLHQKLEKARHDLLDLTGRNRLLNTQRRSSRSSRLEIVDELSAEVHRHLVVEAKAMSFLPVPEKTIPDNAHSHASSQLAQPEEEELDDSGRPVRQVDARLQTELASDTLQRRLLNLFYDARTFEEEQGVNILFLALGFLKWQDADNSRRDRYAPLLLIPVTLERPSAGSRFRLRYTGEEISTNLSLQAKLKVDFGIVMPDVPDGSDSYEMSPTTYCDTVATAVADQTTWEVLPNDIVLWFFSFSKFLMYRDLQPDNWPPDRPIDESPLIRATLQHGFDSDEPVFPNDTHVDDVLQPDGMIHVMDADSSQTLAIEEVKHDRSLVIQGPPGTGKSQTITNLIASAVHSGKTVLFVAEKMAALEVVKRRLDGIGLGEICLELHSHKSNKRAVLDELSQTLELGAPVTESVDSHAADLKLQRDRLNDHARRLHTPMSISGRTPFEVLGELVRLRGAGSLPVDDELVEPLTWTEIDVQQKRNLLKDIQRHLVAIGPPDKHIWRGVRAEAFLPTDIERLTGTLPDTTERLELLQRAAQQLAEMMEATDVASASDVSRLTTFAQRIAAAPAMDAPSIADEAWTKRRADIDQLLRVGNDLRVSRDKLQGILADVAWTTDVTAARRDLVAKGGSFLRFFSRSYWNARSTFLGITKGKPPTSNAIRVEILDDLIRGQLTAKKLEDNRLQDVGRSAFGREWRGEDSDWQALQAIADWEAECRDCDLPSRFRTVAAKAINRDTLQDSIADVAEKLKSAVVVATVLSDSLQLDTQLAFNCEDIESITITELIDRLNLWQSGGETLTQWIGYFHRRKQLDSEGLEKIGAGIDRGALSANEVIDRFDMAYNEELMREVFRQDPELAGFNGTSHEQTLERFRELDAERIRLARCEVAAAHFARIPKGGGRIGELGVLRHEIKKRRRIKPIRRLLKEAGNAVQATKPVFMMSPVSIAQFLTPGMLEFDLLVIDEASQVRPVDALGALTRCGQAVVVGDDKQLPPTAFFSRVAGDDDADDDDGARAADLESILDLCIAANMPQRMLRWHYRSRHQSLIAVSNREFYDEQLYVVPSPLTSIGDLGLKFHSVDDGVFDRGGTATNRIEARAVANSVIKHASEHPTKTLGVGTFSVRQRDAILEEIERLRRANPKLESFFASGTAEPFFVKNLENIQGDERDVIFISVGYGKDEEGRISMNFGPLSNEGGERRLNVLITRSRERCEVFSSMVGGEIDLKRAKSNGAKAFKTFLTFAQSGRFDTGQRDENRWGSGFERQLAEAVGSLEYDLDAQVGTAGFSVDLAVADPDTPGRYLMGIECDGANYQSARSARDRDRIRRSVLEDRGWILHRVWSIDWFHRPDEQLRQVSSSIERAKVEWSETRRTSINRHGRWRVDHRAAGNRTGRLIEFHRRRHRALKRDVLCRSRFRS